MPGLLKRPAVVFVIVVVAAQFVRPSHTNPPTDASRPLGAHNGSARHGRGPRVPRLSFERDDLRRCRPGRSERSRPRRHR